MFIVHIYIEVVLLEEELIIFIKFNYKNIF